MSEIVRIERWCENPSCKKITVLEGKRAEYFGPIKDGLRAEVIREDQIMGLVREPKKEQRSMYYGELDLRYKCPHCGLQNDHMWEEITRDGVKYSIRRQVGVVSLIGANNFNARNINKNK